MSLMAEAERFELSCPGGQPHFESFVFCTLWWKLEEDKSTWKYLQTHLFQRFLDPNTERPWKINSSNQPRFWRFFWKKERIWREQERIRREKVLHWLSLNRASGSPAVDNPIEEKVILWIRKIAVNTITWSMSIRRLLPKTNSIGSAISAKRPRSTY